MAPWHHEVRDLEGTFALGRELGRLLFPGAVIALVGPLGAGKTHLVKAIAEGLEIGNSAVVSSPTFVLVQEYEARLPIFHFDTYRLDNEAQFADLGVHEYFQGRGVSIIEWADRVPGTLPADRLEIRLVIIGPESRRFGLTAFGKRHEDLLAELSSRLRGAGS